MSQLLKFKTIDHQLANYYTTHGRTNYNNQFLQYVIAEQLDDPELPIDDELGDNADPNDCAYTYFTKISDKDFPIPISIQISNVQFELFVFYILQYIYVNNVPPTDHYITQHILHKIKANSISKTHSTNISSVTKHSQTKNTFQRISKQAFKPEYSARAHLNIFTDKEIIKDLLSRIREYFSNELNLYYYTDISAALQMNDKQLNIFEIIKNGNRKLIFGIINYDLHCKQTGLDLYGVIVPNKCTKKPQNNSGNKWLWKLEAFMTESEILKMYGINTAELPKSSRKCGQFKGQLKQRLVIAERIINETDWFRIAQIKSLKRSNIAIPKVSVMLSRELWIKELKLSLIQSSNLPLIPVVVNKNNQHWIEWIKIIYISSQNLHIGLSLKFNERLQKLSVESICLDKGDISNKHRLVGIRNEKYLRQLREFKMSIAEIIFTDNSENTLDKKMTALKQQITSQQNSIVRLKDSISKINNKRKMLRYEQRNKSNIRKCWNINDEIQELIAEDRNHSLMVQSNDFLSEIVDEVIKKYCVGEFVSDVIGMRQNIYINKELARVWMNGIKECFKSVEDLYFYLDGMTALQMIQKNAKFYTLKDSHAFICGIINFELTDLNGNVLYGIANQQNSDAKYKYKLVALMNGTQIFDNFGINCADLPQYSRKCNKEFLDNLLLKRKIKNKDLNNIKWSNLKVYKGQSQPNMNSNHKSITITRNVMSEYTFISLERLSDAQSLIPILIIDKYSKTYWIEWVLIIQIIHRNCPIGLSFKYNKMRDLFEATAIYLEKSEIEIKHRLIGLKHDYCANVHYFSLRKLKFKSGKDTVIDDDSCDEIVFANQNNKIKNNFLAESVKYQKLLKNERLKSEKLQRQFREIQTKNSNTQRQPPQQSYNNGMYFQNNTQQMSAVQNMNANMYPYQVCGNYNNMNVTQPFNAQNLY